MSINRNDLLADPLMPLVNEEPKPALTLSELFNTERVILGAIKDQIVSGITPDKTIDLENVDGPVVSAGKSISNSPAAPNFDFDDPLKNMLASNVWQQMEHRMAGGGYHNIMNNSTESVLENIGFMLRLNMNIYDNLPHSNFIGVQPMNMPCQVFHHHQHHQNDYGVDGSNVVTPINNVITSYAVEATTKRLNTSICSESEFVLDNMLPELREELEDDMMKTVAHQISSELYGDMVGKLVQAAGSSTVVSTAADTCPSALDIIASIQEASAQIEKQAARRQQANWVIMSPQMAAVLLSDPHAIDTSTRQEAPHTSLIGSLYGMDVYMDTEGAIKQNNVLVGRKGEHNFDQGIAFCPYTLAMDGGTVVNPMTFLPVKSLTTRNDYLVPDDASDYFHMIEFKEAPEEYLMEYKAGDQEMDVGYFYCPYIPLMTTEIVEEDLMDIVLPFGAPERKTIAELFGKRVE